MTTEKYRYGTLVARFIAHKLTEPEEKELNEWIASDQGNLKLFEALTNEWDPDFARRWFAETGVSTKGIRWKNVHSWYKPETRARKDYYLVMGAMVLALIALYFYIKYF